MSKPEALHNGTERPKELEDWLNANLYHPLSFRIARLLKNTAATPNALSVAGGLMVVAASLAYLNLPGLLGAVLGLLLHMSWHVLDGADGDLARLTGRTSEMGEVIDGACDYIGHLFLYITLAVILAAEMGWIGATLAIAAGLARGVQTIFFETQRRQYQFWVYDVPWLRVTAGSRSQSADGPFQSAGLAYLALSNALCAGGDQLDALLEQVNGQQKQDARAIIKTQLRPMIESLSILSSNYRTLVIGAAMILGHPIIFVIFELGVLSIVLLFGWRRAQREIGALGNQFSARMDR